MKQTLQGENDKLSAQVYAILVEKIVQGDLIPGEKVSELALSKSLKVSRTPVHDAVRDLMKDGLVEQHGNTRPVVSGFTSDKVLNLFSMRSLLESEAARLAAEKMDRLTLQKLRDMATDVRSHMKEDSVHKKWLEFEAAFHSQIAQSSWNIFLYHDILRYRTIHDVLMRHHLEDSNIEQGLNEHLAILDAIEDRQAEKASELMANHINEWKIYFARRVERPHS